MITLIIKYANGSTYWVEHFDSMVSMTKWLNEEKTRSYWKAEFTTQIVDNTPPPKTPSEIQKEINDLWVAERILKCDKDIEELLAPMQDTTHLMLASYNMYVALNISGDETTESISEAKLRIADSLVLMGQVQALRDERDLEIAEYLETHPV